MKKILLVMHDINYGGAAKMFAFLANGLEGLKHDVYVYTFEGNKPNYRLNKNITYFYESKISKYKLIRRVLPVIKIRKIIKNIDPDIVISFLPNANLYSVIGALGTRSSVIITERSDPYSEQGLLLNLKRLFYNFSDGAVFQTEGAKNYYSKKLQNKSVVIQNPVTLERNPRINYIKRKNEIVHVGRFDIKQKRQDIMVLAFSEVVKIIPDIKLVFYGDGPDLPKIQKMVKDMDLSEKVVFKGKSNHIPTLIKDSKMFVLTSDYEGIPNALIEAMALGLPIITTDCSPGGAKLLVTNAENGLLVPTGDVNGIANAIIYLLNNDKIADSYGEKAQIIIDMYTPSKIMKLWDEYIKTI